MEQRSIIKAYAEAKILAPWHVHISLYGPESSVAQETLMRSAIAAKFFGVKDDPTEQEALANYCIIKGI